MDFQLRKATEADRDLILEWRNDPSMRSQSLSTEVVDRATHYQWFDRIVNDPNRHIMMVEKKDHAIGVLIANLVAEKSYEISINVAPTQRGLGFGHHFLLAIEPYLPRDVTMWARIRIENKASCRVFEKANYKEVKWPYSVFGASNRDVICLSKKRLTPSSK